jgi:SAM-dependent methyltransferase
VEKLNAHGPYDHGLWNEVGAKTKSKGDGTDSSGGLFHERSRHLVDEICRILSERFSTEELSQMTLVDVGCYDGWVIVQIEDRLALKAMVGVEPRRKNINKGVVAREAYGVNTNVEFFEAEIETLDEVLGERNFDIVLCLGTLHHVESTPRAVKQLAARATRMLIIDTMVVSEPKNDADEIRRLLNLRDVAYLDAPQDWAIAAFKYETPYFDGSTTGAPIVNVPQAKLVTMSMESCGLKVEEVNRPDEVAYKADFQKLRGVQEALIVGVRPTDFAGDAGNESSQTWKAKARRHEEQFCFGEVPPSILGLWAANLHIEMPAKRYEVEKIRVPRSLRRLYRASLEPTKRFALKYFQRSSVDPDMAAILVNFSRSPDEKVRLELAKDALRHGEFTVSRQYLKQITEKSGCDWRAFYRSCYFLTVIALLEDDKASFERYEGLLRTANPVFPLTTEEGVIWATGTVAETVEY